MAEMKNEGALLVAPEEEKITLNTPNVAGSDCAITAQLENARQKIFSLTKSSITELRAFAKPPVLVEKIFIAVATFLGKKSDWESAKTLMKSPDFLKTLLTLDVQKIPKSTYTKVKEMLKDENLQPNVVKKASVAAGCISEWLYGMVEIYGIVAAGGNTESENKNTPVQSAEVVINNHPKQEKEEEEKKDVDQENVKINDENTSTIQERIQAITRTLQNINTRSIVELKAFAKPPIAVEKTIAAVATLLGSKSDWASAKKLLGDMQFLKRLIELDISNIPQKTYAKVKEMLKDESLKSEIVRKSSLAAGNLVEWIHGVIEIYPLLGVINQ